MKIPKNTVSPSQLRNYGVGSSVDDLEDDKGCPRRWKARYVDGVVDDSESYPLTYGRLFHRVMENVMVNGVDPDTATRQAIDGDTTVEMVDELIKDIETYLARPSSDIDEMATLGTELDLRAVLYDDEDFGEVTFRAILDWVGVDPEEPNVIHVRDYKSNRSPISFDDLRGDIQTRGQAWMSRAVSARWSKASKVRIVSHLDLVKFRDYVIEYTDAELDAWAIWAEARVRTILRDEEAKPLLNTHCPSCPVRDTCPALLAAPFKAERLAKGPSLEGLEEGMKWRTSANQMRLLLDKAVKAWDVTFKRDVARAGVLEVGGKRYTMAPAERNEVDVFAMARLLGDDFPKVASVSMAAVERATLDESTRSQAMALFRKMPSGTKLTQTKTTTLDG